MDRSFIVIQYQTFRYGVRRYPSAESVLSYVSFFNNCRASSMPLTAGFDNEPIYIQPAQDVSNLLLPDRQSSNLPMCIHIRELIYTVSDIRQGAI